jgi:DNA-binding MarR family transcriptional regulator
MPATKTLRPGKSAGPARTAQPRAASAREPDLALPPHDLRTDSLGYRLRRAQVHAYGLFFEMLGSLALSPARLTALSVIAGETPINQAALAKRLNVAGPSVMKLIDALEGAGYIRRTAVASDRRQYALVLTPHGQAVLQALRERHAAYEAELARTLLPGEREELMRLLQKLLA